MPRGSGHERAHTDIRLLADVPNLGGEVAGGADAVSERVQGILPLQTLGPAAGVAQLAGALHRACPISQGRQGALGLPLPGAAIFVQA